MESQRKEQAREIFMEIIDLPEAERQAKLDELCQGDALLKLDVESLLMAHDDADGFMWNPTASAASTQLVPITEKAGTIIGPYKLLQKIGEGGFGTVFLADQSKPIRRRVALKIIKLGMDTKQVIARFEAERQALALMDHPNIARVLDAGATDTGRPYFVMEYVVGDSITEFADAHKLSVRDRLELFNQACSAVQHAHTKGIIHRDIKPSNILVNMTDGRPFAKVIDFGIAKATAAPLTDKTLFTEHHQLIGTLEYMSPEQAEGLPDIDTRTDVYALGVLLYELLTGQTPLDGKRLRSAAWHEMRRIIKEEEPPAPSMRLSRNIYQLAQVASARQAEPNKLSAILKGELDWIAIKALDKDRTRRYETPSALAADVQRHLDGDAVVAAPVSRSYKMRKFVRRNKGVVIAGSAVAATLLIGIAGTAWQWRESKIANSKLAENISVTKDSLLGIIIDTADFKPDVISSVMADLEISEDEALRELANASVQGIRMGLDAREEVYGESYSPAERSDLGLLALVSGWAVKDSVELRDQLQTQADIARDGMDRISRIAYPVLDEDLGTIGDAFYAGWLLSESAAPFLDAPEEELRLRGLTVFAASQASEMVKSRDAAEWSSYTANLAIAQMAMDNGNWPEARERIAACPESKRGWEWEFLSNKAESVVVEIRGWGGRRPSPDKQHILVSTNRTAQVYDLKGNPVGPSITTAGSDDISPYGMVLTSRYSADGSHFALRSAKKGMKSLRLQAFNHQGIPVGKPIQHGPFGSRYAISSDGRFVATTAGRELRIWDAAGNPVSPVIDQHADITLIRFGPNGKYLLASSKDHAARLWTIKGDPVGGVMQHEGRI